MREDERRDERDKFAVAPHPDLTWRKSSLSTPQECVEVAIQPEVVFVRDSERPDGAWLRFSHTQWQCFIEAAALGEFNLTSSQDADVA